MSTYALNKQTKRDYEILDTVEAGIVLEGYEVKSVRNGDINLKGSYITFTRDGRPQLVGAHISKYKPAGRLPEYDPYRSRMLLLRKNEIDRLRGMLAQKGLTLIPLSVYNKHNRIKLELGVGKGKKKHDKREDLKKRDIQRDVEREIRGK